MKALNKQENQIKIAFYKDINKLQQLSLAQDYKAQAYVQKNNFHQAYANYYLAAAFAAMGEISISSDLLKRIIPFFVEHKCQSYLHQSYLLLGQNENLLGNIEASVKNFDLAIQLNYRSPEASANTLYHLINYLVKFGQYEKAMASAKRALEYLSLKSKYQRKLYFLLLLQTAHIFQLQDEDEKSLEILLKINKAQIQEKLPDIAVLLDQRMAHYYLKRKKYLEAEAYLLKGIKKSINDESLLISLSLKMELSNVYILQDKIKPAEELLLETYYNYPYEENEYFILLLSNLASVYERLGNKEKQRKFEHELCIRTN